MDIDARIIKKIISELYLHSLRSGKFGQNLDSQTQSRELTQTVCIPIELLRDYFGYMTERGLIDQKEDAIPKLSAKGREAIVVVMAGGSFDIIHPGHVETLKQAKALGDVLIVSVARNATYQKTKKRPPIHDETQRRELVASIKYVDAAVLGSEKDIFETVLFLKPDIIALGYDQTHNEKATIEGAEREGIKVKVVRLRSNIPEVKTSKIVNSETKDKLLRDM